MTQDDNSAALAHQQQIEHQQYLLTKESFDKWFDGLTDEQWYELVIDNLGLSSKVIYLKENGLPLDSVIEGL
jgi:hypothetical protein